ncbi:MAG TPA: hypothetical protein VM889_14445, partial [Candidatus Thermoplasmatota archaeon]|nr:hypothetical protein [Candidatus Thermoplasmatota archaeon]
MQAGTPTLDAGRLATALGVPVEALESTLGEVGVDANYLARALREGDPQGAIAAVARRLGLPRPEVVMALVKALATTDGKPAADLASLLDAAARDLAHARATDGDVVVARAPPARPPPRPAPPPARARR